MTFVRTTVSIAVLSNGAWPIANSAEEHELRKLLDRDLDATS